MNQMHHDMIQMRENAAIQVLEIVFLWRIYLYV